MAEKKFSAKRVAIDKANARMIFVVAIATFLTVFSLVASKYLIGREAYQGRVIAQQNKTVDQLNKDISAVNKLEASYKTFETSSATNIIGGANTSTGTGVRDGQNAKIVLDALPSKYDFPALTTSIDHLLNSLNLSVAAINGTDQQLKQQAHSSSPSPQPVSMPFTFTVQNAQYSDVQKLIDTLQLSIRPIQINTMTLNGGETDMKVEVNATTYYQPAKTLQIQTKVVK